ncbi:MaoC family dehydratase [Nocardia vaccinii]|uniref:MaoC family dehydratase n=1 Tax=Nocardia vaccinii TaxID=1822 RepID=UPI00082E678A|nr:MaoC family dehydratase [Nocardia vaccinii]
MIGAAPAVEYESLSDFASMLGKHLGYSGWHTLGQEQVDAFAAATGDHQWIHTDPVRAADGPYGGTIAHGYLVLSLVPILVQQIYRVSGLSMAVNYGSDKLRFPAPVRVGSRIRAGAELTAIDITEGRGRATVRVTVTADGGDRPVCVVDTIAVMVAAD